MANPLPSTFERTYTVQPPASWNATTDKKHKFESSFDIILPQDARNALLNHKCQKPYTFVILDASNPSHKTYVGAQEFSANPSSVIAPNHILQTLHCTEMRVKYICLPSATSIELRPDKSSFIKQTKHKLYIREHLGNRPCISTRDTLNITIDDELHTLSVVKTEPVSCDAVSLHKRAYAINIKILDAIQTDTDDEEEEEEYPISSTIHTTKGDDAMHTMGGGELDVEEDANEDDWGEDEEPADDWDIDESFDSYDGQDQIRFTPPPARKPMDEPLVPDPNSTDDGNSRVLRPVRAKAQHRAWICEYCHAINNLLESMKRQYKCISCAGKYRPGQALIEAKDEDKPQIQKEQWKVWYCECSKLNEMSWKSCDLCNKPQPTEGVMSFWSDEQPIQTGYAPKIPHDPKDPHAPVPKVQNVWQCVTCNWMNDRSESQCQGTICTNMRANKWNEKRKNSDDEVYRPVYHGNLNLMGNVKSVDAYPNLKDIKSTNKRLLNIFGAPYKIKTSQNNNFLVRTDSYCVMKTDSVVESAAGTRCVALNEETGYMAMASTDKLFVFKPCGGYEMVLKAFVCDKTNAIGCGDARVRFVGDEIYVFHPNLFKIFVYLFDEKRATISFMQEIYESYFVDAQIKDFVVTKEALIVLFDRWLGIYRLYPSLEWYHAVAFSSNKHTAVASLEMSIYSEEEEEEEKQSVMENGIECKRSLLHYAFINCEHKLVAVHPSNPTFDFVYVANNVRNGSSFCASRQYGTFYINNEHDRIYQSSGYDATNSASVRIIASLEKSFEWKGFDIDRFEHVLYDESFGIWGRLLVGCTLKDSKKKCTFYECFNWSELMCLQQELQSNEYCLMPGVDSKPFNLIVFVFEMLYGSDVIDSFIESPDWNPMYALPLKEEEEDALPLKEEEDALPWNRLLQINSKCLISVDGRWYDAVVVREFSDASNRVYFDVSYQYNGESKSKSVWKYSKCLKYNEAIAFEGRISEDWKCGDQCVYYCSSSDVGWYPAEVMSIAPALCIRIKYHNGSEWHWVNVPFSDDIPLCKLKDVIENAQQGEDDDDDDDDMEGVKEL
eukprot:185116_1